MQPVGSRSKRRPLARVCGVLIAAGTGVGLLSVVAAAREPQIVLTACFSNIGGLAAGDDVTLNGLLVGHVDRLVLDEERRPCAELELRSDLRLDLDTSASIFTKNVLGEKYIALDPGGSDELLGSGDYITFTQSALPIERIMIRLLEHQLGSSFE